MKRKISPILFGIGVGIVGAFGIPCSEYQDFPGFSNKSPEAGRTQNSIAAVVSGIVGQKIYGSSDVDMEIEKTFFPNARVTGNTTPSSVNTYVGLSFTSAAFNAKNNSEGMLEGEVDKSEFNWGVKQSSSTIYDIARFGPKFDGFLDIHVENGKINGNYVRGGPHFDWPIEGTYDAEGNVKCTIDGPLTLGITLKGKITPK